VGTVIEARNIEQDQARQAQFDVLNQTGQALAAELDLEHIVQIVTDAGVQLSGAKFGAFFYNVMDEAGESLLLYTLSGAEREDFDGFGHPRATEVFGPTFRGEGVIRSDDITADARYGKNSPHSGMLHGHLPVRSYLAVPVISRSGEVIGGLFFAHPEPGIFNEESERLLLGLAGQAAVASTMLACSRPLSVQSRTWNKGFWSERAS
jgi:GAF domain-containing protein